MKHILLATIVFFLSSKENVLAQRKFSDSQLREKSIDANGLLDKILLRVAETLKKDGLDSLKLEYYNIVNFTLPGLPNTKWLNGVGWFGGQLDDYTSIHRNGDAILDYDTLGALELVGDVEFGDLQVEYSFGALAMNLELQGTIHARVKDLQVHFVVAINPDDFSIKLREFARHNFSDVNVQVCGFSILNTILSGLANVFLLIFKNGILNMVESEVRKKAETAIATLELSYVG